LRIHNEIVKKENNWAKFGLSQIREYGPGSGAASGNEECGFVRLPAEGKGAAGGEEFLDGFR
jgi:hypothetical protein